MPSFANEISDLQHLFAKLSEETCTISIEFTPKYHCEIAGEGIEYCWGSSNKIQRVLLLKDRRKVEGFINSVKCYLKRVTPVRMRQFARRARKYMLAYHQIGENPTEGAALRDRIDAIADNFYSQQQPGIVGRGRMPIHSLLNDHRMKKPLLTCMKQEEESAES
jgi:hypothetical protein